MPPLLPQGISTTHQEPQISSQKTPRKNPPPHRSNFAHSGTFAHARQSMNKACEKFVRLRQRFTSSLSSNRLFAEALMQRRRLRALSVVVCLSLVTFATVVLWPAHSTVSAATSETAGSLGILGKD